jgi:hypothetical protein
MQARQIIQAVMQEVQGLAKKDKNTHQGFAFRGIDAVMNAVGPALRKHGGFMVPQVIEKTHEIMNGKLNLVRITVSYSVYGSEGEPITGWVAAEAFDSGDKATAKAMSVAYRTALLQTLCLPTDEQDPDAETFERSPAQTPKPRASVGSYAGENSKPAPSTPKATKKPADGKPAGNGVISEAQLGVLHKLAKKTEVSESDLVEIAGKAIKDLSLEEASSLINDLLAVTKDTAEFAFVDGVAKIVHHD